MEYQVLPVPVEHGLLLVQHFSTFHMISEWCTVLRSNSVLLIFYLLCLLNIRRPWWAFLMMISMDGEGLIPEPNLWVNGKNWFLNGAKDWSILKTCWKRLMKNIKILRKLIFVWPGLPIFIFIR